MDDELERDNLTVIIRLRGPSSLRRRHPPDLRHKVLSVAESGPRWD